MSSDRFEVQVTGDLEPPFVKALNVAMDMAAEEGWTVETVIAHKMHPEGLAMWRVHARGDEADAS